MSNLTAFTRSAVVATALAAAAFGTTAAPASAAAAAPCQVSGSNPSPDGTPNEWALAVTFRSKGLSCASVKTVLRTCSNKRTVPGWKITKSNGNYRFTSRSKSSRRFTAMGIGGLPLCISEVEGY